MVFPSVTFLLFFPPVLALSWLLMPRPALWKPFILLVSYLFYAAASWRYCLLLALMTVVNQAAALGVARHREDPRRTKWIVTAAVVFDLGVLGVFKYYGFFTEEVGALLDSVGLGLPLPLLTLALPIGISFFVFQAISYPVDVRRGLVEPTSLANFGIYLSFFPHLVAGPIVRAREFLPQLEKPRDPRKVAVGAGVVLICLGVVKKVMIADYLAREIVDPVFGAPEVYGAWDTIVACYAYTAQIYCDFSGYTDIAIGLALLMGFVFPQNFDRPYRAASIREFWRRWHITLSRYLRDFIYIPLGGNRKGPRRTAINLMATMVLGGLWHGAAWTFVLWGALHGGALTAEHRFKGRVRMPVWLGWLLTLHVVVFGWILFRSQDLETVGAVLGQLVDFSIPSQLVTVPVLVAAFGVIGAQLLPTKRLGELRLRVEAWHPVALGLTLAATIVIVGSTVPSQGVPPFIYFAF